MSTCDLQLVAGFCAPGLEVRAASYKYNLVAAQWLITHKLISIAAAMAVGGNPYLTIGDDGDAEE